MEKGYEKRHLGAENEEFKKMRDLAYVVLNKAAKGRVGRYDTAYHLAYLIAFRNALSRRYRRLNKDKSKSHEYQNNKYLLTHVFSITTHKSSVLPVNFFLEGSRVSSRVSHRFP